MKIVGRVLEMKIRYQVQVDEIQFGFLIGKESTGAIFIVRLMMEKT